MAIKAERTVHLLLLGPPAMFEFTYILDSGSKRCGRGGDIREAPLRSKRREEMDREETGC
jgi:hypothetical protein